MQREINFGHPNKTHKRNSTINIRPVCPADIRIFSRPVYPGIENKVEEMNHKLLTDCKWLGCPPNGNDDCEPYLDDGHGKCWCYRDLKGFPWCNIVNCEKGENNKND
jgi:hypothetical protein